MRLRGKVTFLWVITEFITLTLTEPFFSPWRVYVRRASGGLVVTPSLWVHLSLIKLTALLRFLASVPLNCSRQEGKYEEKEFEVEMDVAEVMRQEDKAKHKEERARKEDDKYEEEKFFEVMMDAMEVVWKEDKAKQREEEYKEEGNSERGGK